MIPASIAESSILEETESVLDREEEELAMLAPPLSAQFSINNYMRKK